MKFVFFVHSLYSDWNHGNAHFLRGIVGELRSRGHDVRVYEPAGGWSLSNMLQEPKATESLELFRRKYPGFSSEFYLQPFVNLDDVLVDADVVLVHEWNDHDLVARIGEHRKEHDGYKLFFHDTHHRAATEPQSMGAYDLSGYDGVLAFGEVIRQIYLKNGWAKDAWTWHEAADVRVYKPLSKGLRHSGSETSSNGHQQSSNPAIQQSSNAGDLVWIGNWGDDERTAELHEFLINPVKELGLKAKLYGVRYPKHALESLKEAGIEYGGWLTNQVPEEFSKYKVTVHVPRRPYTQALPGVPTIRVFEALACGIPLISAPWSDSEGLFREGDFLWAKSGGEMKEQLEKVLEGGPEIEAMVKQGLETIMQRHTCGHRVDELLTICESLESKQAVTA